LRLPGDDPQGQPPPGAQDLDARRTADGVGRQGAVELVDAEDGTAPVRSRLDV
jgi:hypothetical protein